MITTDCRSAKRSGLLPAAAAVSPKPSRLWLWFIAAFAIQLAAWTIWFVVASHHKVQEVPLEAAPKASAPTAR